jgi:hypothetical protein
MHIMDIWMENVNENVLKLFPSLLGLQNFQMSFTEAIEKEHV